jgi:hypothetical protein
MWVKYVLQSSLDYEFSDILEHVSLTADKKRRLLLNGLPYVCF